jgi:hypothetical protein
MVLTPRDSAVVARVALPAISVEIPSKTLPSKKLTLPVGVPLVPGLTDAVSVTEPPLGGK